MREVSREKFLASLRSGDIGYNLSKNFLATLQKLYHHKYGEGPERASHAFAIETPPDIIEANFPFVEKNAISPKIGSTSKVWIIRYRYLTASQHKAMTAFLRGALEGRAVYSWKAILLKGLYFFGIRKRLKDAPGMYCNEMTELSRRWSKIPRAPEEPFTMTPSDSLRWDLGPGADVGHYLAAHYDGAGGYWISAT